jgi:hypothetical protein
VLSLVPSYAALCAAQAATIAGTRADRSRDQVARRGWLGLALPALALAAGIGIVRGVSGGPQALALFGAVATPALAAAGPWRAPVSLALWLVAWLAHGLVAQAAAVALIALAAARVATFAARLAPAWSLELGLVALVVLDVVLVWGTPQAGPATTALHRAALPTIPRLQDATFGSATMGWLDFLAPALAGVVIVRARVVAAVATGLAAGAWGVLLAVTSTVPATVPVLAALPFARCGSPSSPTSTRTSPRSRSSSPRSTRTRRTSSGASATSSATARARTSAASSSTNAPRSL